MINCIIVEDSPLAVEKLTDFIRQVPVLHLLQSFDNGIEAIAFIQTQTVDLVFLDIQMEQFSGLQFLEAVRVPPKVIIVSAYSKYAIQGFEHNVCDYLLKPYSFERFLKAIDKVQSELKVTAAKTWLFVKTEYRMERVDFCDVLYIEGMGAYLRIVCKNAKIMTLQTFSQIEKALPANQFLRIHKSFIVSLDKIENVERNVVKIGEQRIPVGKNYQEEFYRKLNAV